jgi:hypothetical protein
VLFGGVAWADPTPAPGGDTTEAPVTQPSSGTWISGGTLLESTSSTDAQPAAKPAAVAPARTTTRTTTRSTGTRRTTTSTAPDGASALPFTGNHVDALLPAGVSLLVGGAVLMLAGRPRRVAA